MKLRLVLPALLLPLLAACVNDAASYQIDGREHSLSLIREQKWFWDKTVILRVVVSRMPECQRRHTLQPARISQSRVEVYQPGRFTYVLKQGDRMYLVETRTCEGFQQLDAEPPGGLGVKVGTFVESGDGFHFVPEAPPQGQR